ncbi:MAG: nucleoside-diphosphate kinase [Bacteroidota bacterium]
MSSSLKQTLAIIKPTAVTQRHTGDIIACIEKEGFRLKVLKMTEMSVKDGKSFYAEHAERHFFEELYQYISSGKVVVMVLEKENAIADFRKLIGATDPKQALAGTIRNKFGMDTSDNAIHGSDSPESAAREISFFFPSREVAG